MNIVVYSSDSGNFFFKPDNTLVRDSKDFFPPRFVTEISVALAIVVKISKSCKFTSMEYAGRYYNELGAGILIFPENLIKADNLGLSCLGKALSLDNTTYISEKLHNIGEISQPGEISLLLDNNTLLKKLVDNSTKALIAEAIENITQYSTLKSGDLIYIYSSEKIPVNIGSNIKLSHFSEVTLDFNIR